MRLTKREKIDKHFKRASSAAKFIKKHINKTLGIYIQNIIDDVWSRSYLN